MQVNTEQLVEAYIKIRDARADLKAKYEQEDQELQAEIDVLKQSLLAICAEVNVDSLKTGVGTASRKLNERFYCTDWDGFRSFEQQNPEYDFRERRVHQGNFREYLTEHQNDGLPPGINVLREYDIVVRRANSKV
jgi:hypothetical protein